MGPRPVIGRNSRRETLVRQLPLFGRYERRWREYYLRKIGECKTLAKAERESSGNLSQSLVRLKLERRRWMFPIIIGTIAIVVCGIAVNLFFKGPVAEILLLIALLTASSITFLTVAVFAERRGEYRLVYAFYHLIQYIELNAVHWEDYRFRGRINRKIEEAARAIERIPNVFQLQDPVSVTAIMQLARRKAFALRELKIWVTQATSPAFNDLLSRLGTDLVIVANRRWRELPDPESPEAEASAADGRIVSRWRRNLLVLLAIVTSVAAAAVLSLQDRFGSTAAIASTVLGTVALGLLGSVGLSADRIKQLTETWVVINKPPK